MKIPIVIASGAKKSCFWQLSNTPASDGSEFIFKKPRAQATGSINTASYSSFPLPCLPRPKIFDTGHTRILNVIPTFSMSYPRRRVSITVHNSAFLKDVLSQSWMPKSGRVIELGCGTGPILRWVCKRGFSGLGIDVSKTAIAMAKEQSKGLDIKFRQSDVCSLNRQKIGRFDLVIDGLCLHCITEAKDRKAYLANVHKLLKNDGVFILLSMCSPVDRIKFRRQCPDFKLHKNIIYSPSEKKVYQETRKFGSRDYMANRFVGHWKSILSEISKAGFELKLIRYHANNSKDAFGTLTVGAMKK